VLPFWLLLKEKWHWLELSLEGQPWPELEPHAWSWESLPFGGGRGKKAGRRKKRREEEGKEKKEKEKKWENFLNLEISKKIKDNL
jgi:hypothetical protein